MSASTEGCGVRKHRAKIQLSMSHQDMRHGTVFHSPAEYRSAKAAKLRSGQKRARGLGGAFERAQYASRALHQFERGAAVIKNGPCPGIRRTDPFFLALELGAHFFLDHSKGRVFCVSFTHQSSLFSNELNSIRRYVSVPLYDCIFSFGFHVHRFWVAGHKLLQQHDRARPGTHST